MVLFFITGIVVVIWTYGTDMCSQTIVMAHIQAARLNMSEDGKMIRNMVRPRVCDFVDAQYR